MRRKYLPAWFVKNEICYHREEPQIPISGRFTYGLGRQTLVNGRGHCENSYSAEGQNFGKKGRFRYYICGFLVAFFD